MARSLHPFLTFPRINSEKRPILTRNRRLSRPKQVSKSYAEATDRRTLAIPQQPIDPVSVCWTVRD